MENGLHSQNGKSKKGTRRARNSGGGAVAAHNVKSTCWNRKHGCTFTGDSTLLAQHLEQECRFHEITCVVCNVCVLQMDISKHLRQGCCKSAEAAGGIAATSVSANSASRLQSTATASSDFSPLTVRDVDRAFTELKEMFAALTANQIAVVETRVNELSENVASLGATLLNMDEGEMEETTEQPRNGGDSTELLNSVVAKMGDLSKEIATLRTTVLKSTDTAAKKTAKLQDQLGRCAQREQLNVVERKVNELREVVTRNNAQLMMNTADIKGHCELLAEDSTVFFLQEQLKEFLDEFSCSERKSSGERRDLQRQFCLFLEQYRKDKADMEWWMKKIFWVVFGAYLLKLS